MCITRKEIFKSTNGNTSNEYDEVGEFVNGFARVYIHGKGWGFIDSSFNEICQIKYDFVGNFYDHMAPVNLDGLFGLIDEQGKEICPVIYENIWGFSPEGIALVQRNGKYGFINKKGEEVAEPKYSEICSMRVYTTPSIAIKGSAYDIVLEGSTDRLKPHWFVWWKNKYAITVADAKQGLIDREGRVILEPTYNSILLPIDNTVDYIPVCANGKWGIIDDTGKLIVDLCYDSMKLVSHNLIKVYKDGKCGFIDGRGKILCPIKYTKIRRFVNGHAIVKIGDKYSFINESFKEIHEVSFEEVYDFDSHGFGKVTTRFWCLSRTRKIDRYGNVI